MQGYNLVEEIGHGQRSVVHKAVCTRGRLCSRLVVVKVNRQFLTVCFSHLNYDKVTRLEGHTEDDLEVSLASSSKLQQELYHPGILTLYSAFVQSSTYIQVLEYCSLGNLAEYKEVKGLPSPAEPFIFRPTRGIANGLIYLRDRKIVHRAIQPTNIFLGENQTPV